MSATLADPGAMGLVKRLPRAATGKPGSTLRPSTNPLPCSKERPMMQLLQRLTAPFWPRRTNTSTQRQTRRALLGVEVFEDRLAPAGTFLFDGSYSWGERQSVPAEQVSHAA